MYVGPGRRIIDTIALQWLLVNAVNAGVMKLYPATGASLSRRCVFEPRTPLSNGQGKEMKTVVRFYAECMRDLF